MKKNNLAYLVVTYNGEQTLDALIYSITKKNDILIVDNGSTDRTLSIAEKWGVRILRNEMNKGYATAINQGMSFLERDYEYVFVLNQDVVLDQFSPLPHSEWSRFAVIQPLILLPNGRVNVDILRMNVFGYVYPLRYGEIPKIQNRQEIFFFSGAAFIIQTKTYHIIGPFDDSLFLYYEDIDYAFRILLREGKILFDPFLTVIHAYKNSIRTVYKKKLLSRNRKKIINRYFHSLWRSLLFVKRQIGKMVSSRDQKVIAVKLKRELLLGFYTTQISLCKRYCINLFLIPYSWFVRLFL